MMLESGRAVARSQILGDLMQAAFLRQAAQSAGRGSRPRGTRVVSPALRMTPTQPRLRGRHPFRKKAFTGQIARSRCIKSCASLMTRATVWRFSLLAYQNRSGAARPRRIDAAFIMLFTRNSHWLSFCRSGAAGDAAGQQGIAGRFVRSQFARSVTTALEKPEPVRDSCSASAGSV